MFYFAFEDSNDKKTSRLEYVYTIDKNDEENISVNKTRK